MSITSRGSGLICVLVCLISVVPSYAQSEITELRSGAPVERTLASGQTQNFTVALERNQFLQIVVDQRGIDVVVRIFSPEGQILGVYDTPNGASGPEGASVVARSAGVYRIEVAPLEQGGSPASGRYEIKIVDLRAATKAELDASVDPQARKEKGLALLKETAESLAQIRRAENRVNLQIQAAQLLWDTDQSSAANLFRQATEAVKDYLNSVDPEDPNYFQTYQAAQNLRANVINGIAATDPELALEFLRATRILIDPNTLPPGYVQPNSELQLETTLATQVANKNPKRALQLALESLKKGYSYNLVETINRLQGTDRAAAGQLAAAIADKLKNENILKNQEATQLVINLLQTARNSPRRSQGGEVQTPGGNARQPLLSDEQYNDLLAKTLSAAVAFKPSVTNPYSMERNNAQNILNSLRQLSGDVEKLGPGFRASLEKRANELNGVSATADVQNRSWQQVQEAINNNPINAALVTVQQAPPEMREQLFQQIAWRAVNSGDLALARQIINDHVANSFQRTQALKGIEMQAIFFNASHGNIDAAMSAIANLRTPRERAAALMQVIGQNSRAMKRSALLSFSEQARGLIGGGRAEDQEHMNALLMLARLYFRLDPQRGLELIEPLIDQFNEMSAAAVALNNFVGQQFYQDGELSMQNGNTLGNIATQLIGVCGSIAVSDFDRAKATADRLQRPEVRLAAYLAIAQNAIKPGTNPGSPDIFYYTQ